MTLIKEVVCSKCGRKQVRDLEDLLKGNLFWRTCEFCQRYGLYRTIRQKMTSLSDWLTVLYRSMDFTPLENSISAKREE
jgi:hypothetical protein